MSIRTRRDLIAAVESAVKLRTQRYAFVEGRVEVLGGFSELPPGPGPGWIVRLTSKYGRTWLLALIPMIRRPIMLHLSEVPWEHWVGPTGNPLYDGDNPDEYERLKERWHDRPTET